MYNLQPKDASDARRMAECWKKALQLRNEGYDFYLAAYDAEDNTGIVPVTKPGRIAPSYTIYVNTAPAFENGCTCPDFQQYGSYCKHTLALEDLLQENALVAEHDAQEQALRNAIGGWFVD